MNIENKKEFRSFRMLPLYIMLPLKKQVIDKFKEAVGEYQYKIYSYNNESHFTFNCNLPLQTISGKKVEEIVFDLDSSQVFSIEYLYNINTTIDRGCIVANAVNEVLQATQVRVFYWENADAFAIKSTFNPEDSIKTVNTIVEIIEALELFEEYLAGRETRKESRAFESLAFWVEINPSDIVQSHHIVKKSEKI